MSGAMPVLFRTPSWRGQAKLYVYLVPFRSIERKYATNRNVYVRPDLYKVLALRSLCVARIKPVSTVTDIVLCRFSPRQNTKQ